MLINHKDIVRIEGKQDVIEVGGKARLAGTQIAMHKPTGVVFIKQSFKEGDLYGFTVGKLDANGDVQEKVEFFDRTEKDFFAAVKHFEELIKKMQPEDQTDSTPPSIGKFYYYKKKTGKKCLVDMPGLPVVEIDADDVDTVFTPPQSRPYGRLDMTIVDKPEYATIMSKFALKYDKQKCEEVSKLENLALSDFAVYDMTPYSNNTDPQQQQDDAPDDVNDNDLSPDQIEGEDLNDDQNKQNEKDQKEKKKKEQQSKQEKGEKGEKSDDKQKSDQKDEGDGEKSEKQEKGDGEKNDKQNGDQTDEGDGEKSDSQESGDEGDSGDEGEESDKKSKSSSELTDKDRNSEGKDKGDKDQKPSDKDEDAELSDETKISDEDESENEENESDTKKQNHVNKEGDAHQKKDDQTQHKQQKDDAVEQAQQIPPSEFTDALREMYSGADLKDQFRRQKNLIMSLDSFSEQELKENIYKRLGVSQTLSKSDFMTLVETKTKNLFQ